jgi:SAM-dependent methyltransferase
MSIDGIHEKVVSLILGYPDSSNWREYLDIGAGRGSLIEKLKSKLSVHASACDYTDTLMDLPGQKVDVVNLNNEGLPYPDASFDIVTATEVIEHLEDFRRVTREIYRVLRPGGICILSTPNILNLNSRLRFLSFGFWNLFGPLPVKNSELYSTGGHINPISWFYVAHAMIDAGFLTVTPHIDRVQRSSLVKLAVFYPFIKFFGTIAMWRERKRYCTIDVENQLLVEAMNGIELLVGRTVIACGVKSAVPNASQNR